MRQLFVYHYSYSNQYEEAMEHDVTHIDYCHKTPWFIWPLVVVVLAAFIQPIVMGMGQ